VLTVLTSGTFGSAVAAAIGDHRPDRRSQALAPGTIPTAVREASFVILAAWRPYEPECLALDLACRELGIAWSSCVLRGSDLWCGPLLDPAVGPCYACFRRRRRAHLQGLDREDAIEAAFAADPTLGPAGFPPPAVGIAAASMLAAADGMSRPGRLRRIDLLTGDVVETEVVPVHGCERCGAPDARTGGRFTRHLVPVLAEGLKWS
jgi:bacteriocin biosynthesis cyclodehydratase domain-containing protein